MPKGSRARERVAWMLAGFTAGAALVGLAVAAGLVGVEPDGLWTAEWVPEQGGSR